MARAVYLKYTHRVYGFTTFGTVYGLSNTISGMGGMILGPIDLLIRGPLRGNHTPINLMWLVLGVLASVGLMLRTRDRTGSLRLE